MGRREDTGHGYTNVRMMAIVPILTTEGNVSHGKGITELPCQQLEKQKIILKLKLVKMEVSKLLKPRFKVIADFPDSDYEIGSIQDRDWSKYVNGEDETDGVIWKISDFPHLFKKLEWWEERDISEMPMYLKQTGMVDGAENPLPDVFVKVIDHFSAGNGEWRHDSINVFCADSYLTGLKRTSYNYSGWIPATEQEYNDFISPSIKPINHDTHD